MRAQVVTFSNSYYDVQQSIVALKGSKIVKNHTSTQLRPTGTATDRHDRLLFVDQPIRPTKSPRVYDSLADAASALETGQIDAIVLDTPDVQYRRRRYRRGGQVEEQYVAAQVSTSRASSSTTACSSRRANKLVGCVNAAIAAIKSDGTLASLQSKWLSIYTSVPVIKP